MRQFDIVRNGQASKSSITPYLIVLQHSVLLDSPTVIVAPISRIDADKAVRKLNIPITVQGNAFHIIMQEMAATHANRIRGSIENRSDLHSEIITAVDKLFSGF